VTGSRRAIRPCYGLYARRAASRVVQNDVFHRREIGSTVVRVPVSNRERANLRNVSVVNLSQILTVDKEELEEYTGDLSAPAVEAVRDGLHLLFDQL